jgi:hypothetical protein
MLLGRLLKEHVRTRIDEEARKSRVGGRARGPVPCDCILDRTQAAVGGKAVLEIAPDRTRFDRQPDCFTDALRLLAEAAFKVAGYRKIDAPAMLSIVFR